jgi:alcohol dehydrogenase (cytochrome c)
VADHGSVFTLPGFGNQEGYFVAIHATTGKVAWRHRWPESCYAGTATTAGGLTFVGRNDGRLQAYDAESGDELWSFQTGAGANNAPTFFEQDGTQYVVFYAGGNSLAASPHGDNLWLFSLDGTLGEAKGTGTGAGGGHAGEAPAKPTNQGKGNAAMGEATFADNCSGCHGLSGRGGNGGPDLTNIPTASNAELVAAQVTNGGGGMPSFQGTLSPKEIRDVTAYVVQEITAKK